MGTGIVSILLHNLPYNGAWLKYISVIIFVFNIFLFCTFLAISLARYILYPQIWTAMIRHPAQSLFLGTFPMGLATIINMIVFVCVPAWGGWVVYLVSFTYLLRSWGTGATWMRTNFVCEGLDFVVDRCHYFCSYLLLSSFRNVCFPFHSNSLNYLTNRSCSMSLHKVELSTMTAAWLLPIVAPIVAAASGGIVASVRKSNFYLLNYTVLDISIRLFRFWNLLNFLLNLDCKSSPKIHRLTNEQTKTYTSQSPILNTPSIPS